MDKSSYESKLENLTKSYIEGLPKQLSVFFKLVDTFLPFTRLVYLPA